MTLLVWLVAEATVLGQAPAPTSFDLAHLTPDDIVSDLGSGDGRMVIAAAKRGARATGIEYNPDI